ncbi:peptide-methionine (S)-S-oxide reductase [Natranaerovirga pectinivora]|uniref:Peptide methionine sulfoxide reductase MsrA n=1 Tax=Natranaerovirga pectinivora TaxID=682400 RepID=A0A4R3MP52_9FIRM|nr:peptide-methionine (S)-S-oxide reductase MsrA [Natranaerovirga pectinivora]TCT16302.1 peptide-methionine (S)-S-oxide reductase [Natranaerovirga pectinivora]
MKEIVLAGGCFWGVEAYLNLIPGVTHTKAVYANGITKNPTYEDVLTGQTKFVEAVYIEYNEKILSLQQLIEAYWKIIDPTLLNQQGPDMGEQYRTGIYYVDEDDLATIKISLSLEQKKYTKPIVTEIKPLENFFIAEEYHQQYLRKNPNGYCHINLSLYK